jgi:hypothetical protein
MVTKRILLGLVLTGSLGIPSVSQAGHNDHDRDDHDDNSNLCAPGVLQLDKGDELFRSLYKKLHPQIGSLDADLATLEAAATPAAQKTAYDALAIDAKAYLVGLGATFTPGVATGSFKSTDYRLLIAEADGTVVLDSSKPFDASISNPSGVCSDPTAAINCVANWQKKVINENHNSRISVLDAQLWPCGIGAEAKFSSSLGFVQSYVAIRLTVDKYLHSEGTARLSK